LRGGDGVLHRARSAELRQRRNGALIRFENSVFARALPSISKANPSAARLQISRQRWQAT
jgi:hypothetical protein